MKAKLCFISDTHGLHDSLKINPCDILVHAGDFTEDPGHKAFRLFLKWFEVQPAKAKILIAGNHDRALELWPNPARAMIKEIAPSCVYLQDSGIELMGIKFWGSPYTPRFFDWAFNEDRGAAIKRHWDLIPNDTEVLITHGPADGLLDKVKNEACGCADLRVALNRVRPKVHAFGHIHYSYGRINLWHDDKTVTEILNCSYVGENYKPKNPPHYLDL